VPDRWSEQVQRGVAQMRASGLTFGQVEALTDPVPLDPEQELRTWWFNKASAEADQTVAKAIEYGSDDLVEIGRQMATVLHLEGPYSTDAELAELGVYFYIIGKLARWTSAIRRGDRPSDDTLLDIGVYVRMAQRIRDAGGWPGTESE